MKSKYLFKMNLHYYKAIEEAEFENSELPKLTIVEDKVFRQEIECGISAEAIPVWVKFVTDETVRYDVWIASRIENVTASALERLDNICKELVNRLYINGFEGGYFSL